MLYRYRVSKYNPIYREQDVYTKNEWTDYSDVGDEFGGGILNYQDYLDVERNYLCFLNEVLHLAEVESMTISGYEPISNLARFQSLFVKPVEIKSKKKILSFAKGCLRNKFWGKLNGQTLDVHFGYDFYMYVGCSINESTVTALAEKYNLFCEEKDSPYAD